MQARTRTTRSSSTRRATVLVPLLVVGLAMALVPATAGPLPPPAPEPYPKVVFVARNDIPFDAMAAGPVAGALGGILLVTSPTSWSTDADAALKKFSPDVVYIAGGTAAVSQDVEDAIDAAGPWEVRRKAGANRNATAALLGDVLTDLGVGRPVLTVAGSGQVVGDVYIGGNVNIGGMGAGNVTHVYDNATSTENAQAVRDAIAPFSSRTGAATEPHHVIVLGPGVYDFDSTPLRLPPKVTLRGSGRHITELKFRVPAGASNSIALTMGANSRLEDLQLSNFVPGEGSAAVTHEGVATIERSTITATIFSGSGNGSGLAVGFLSNANVSSSVRFVDSSFTGFAEALDGYGALILNSAVTSIDTSFAGQSTDANAYDLHVTDAPLFNVVGGSFSGFSGATGIVFDSAGVTGTVRDSQFTSTGSVSLDVLDGTLEVVGAKIAGATTTSGSGTITCFGTYDENLAAYAC